ncbi:MAG: hypothetical protein VW405_01040 [Rhodospirillaceae bacterium]
MAERFVLKVVGSTVVESIHYVCSGEAPMPDGFVEVDAATFATAPAGATQNPDGTFTPPPVPDIS